jgi:hypothetical protein
MNLQVLQNVGNFLTSWGPFTFSGRTLLQGVTSLVNSHVQWAVNFLWAPLCRTENGNYNLCARMCSIWLGWAFSWNLCRYIHNPTESYLNLYSHVCKLQLENCSTDFYKIQYQWILQSLVEPLQYSLTTDNSDNNFTWRPTYIYCNFNYAWGELKPAPLLGYGKNKIIWTTQFSF